MPRAWPQLSDIWPRLLMILPWRRPPPPPPPPLHPLIAYSVTRYSSLRCFRYTLINVLIGKHNRYFFKITFDCVHSLITNITRYDRQSSARGNQRCDGVDAADGTRWQGRAACVNIIASPAATTIAARHRALYWDCSDVRKFFFYIGAHLHFPP